MAPEPPAEPELGDEVVQEEVVDRADGRSTRSEWGRGRIVDIGRFPSGRHRGLANRVETHEGIVIVRFVRGRGALSPWSPQGSELGARLSTFYSRGRTLTYTWRREEACRPLRPPAEGGMLTP